MQNTNKGFRLSIFILALSFGGVLMVSALFAVNNYFSAKRLIDQEIEQSFDYRHRIIQLKLDEDLGRLASRLAVLSDYEPLIYAVLEDNRKTIENILFEALQNDEARDLDVLMLSTSEGEIVGDVSSPLSPLSENRVNLIQRSSHSYQQWKVVELDDEKKTTALHIVTPVIEPELGRVVGEIHSAIALSDNRRFARTLMDVADVSQVFIVNDRHVLAQAVPKVKETFDPIQLSREIDKNANMIVQLDDHIASRTTLVIDAGGEAGLSIISLLKRDTTTSLFGEFGINAILLIGAALITAICIAYLVRGLAGHSTHRLLSYVDQVRQGERQAKFVAGPVQEFNHLGDVLGQMVETIHENERYLTNLIDRANSPIIAWTADGRVAKFNKAAERIFGLDTELAEGKPIKDIMDGISIEADDKESVLKRSTNGAVIDRWEMVQKNKKTFQEFFMSWSISPVAFNEDGSTWTILAQGLDMTERKLAENELQQINEELEERVAKRTQALEDEVVERRHIEGELRNSEERFRDIAEASSDWFWEMGADLRFTFMSERALNVTGFTRDEVIGKTRLDLVSPERLAVEQAKWDQHVATLERHEKFRAYEYTVINKSGEERVFRISGKPRFNKEKNKFLGYRGSGRDVTNEYHRKEELRLAKEEAESASQAKTEFLSAMSHELRTPLNGILGFGQLLLMPKGSQLNDSQKEFIRQIVKAGEHLLNLINEILDLAKIEARKVQLSFEPVSPVNVMQDVTDLLGAMAQDYGIRLINEIEDAELPPVEADFTRLKQVLVNLGSNAIKYNHKGGLVQFTCEVCEDETMVQFNVVDDGAGIDPTSISDLFKPFNRLDAEFSDVEGTGIGLTITHQLVGLMGGYIGVESHMGEGSHFWFRLPIYSEKSEHNKLVSEQPYGALKIEDLKMDGHIKILYVEDNPNNSQLMEDALEPFGNLDLKVVVSAEEGLSYLQGNDVDLLFLDINLPGMSGWQMVETLRKDDTLSELPVVAVTAQAMQVDLKQAQDVGFDGFLPKPINLSDLFRIIRQYMQAE